MHCYLFAIRYEEAAASTGLVYGKDRDHCVVQLIEHFPNFHTIAFFPFGSRDCEAAVEVLEDISLDQFEEFYKDIPCQIICAD